jgi:hypothetical protein
MTYCKLGDRAIVVHSQAHNEGKIVKVLGPHGFSTGEVIAFQGHQMKFPTGMYLWIIESLGMEFRNLAGEAVTGSLLYPDQWLRPMPKVTDPIATVKETA